MFRLTLSVELTAKQLERFVRIGLLLAVWLIG
jgi:hypothetical protein